MLYVIIKTLAFKYVIVKIKEGIRKWETLST